MNKGKICKHCGEKFIYFDSVCIGQNKPMIMYHEAIDD